MPDNKKKYYSRPEHVLLKEVGEEMLLLNVESESYYSLNEVGVTFYEELTSGKDSDTALAALLDLYPNAKDKVTSDCNALLEKLLSQRLLVADDT